MKLEKIAEILDMRDVNASLQVTMIRAALYPDIMDTWAAEGKFPWEVA